MRKGTSPESLTETLLVARMSMWALVLPLLRRIIRFDTLARWMWSRPRATRAPDVQRIVQLSRLVARRRPPMSENRCLERSLLAYRFLSAASADPKLVVALRRSDAPPRGHAWITVAGHPVGEPEPLEDYVPLVVYGRGGRRED